MRQVDDGSPLQVGQIRESNRTMLTALVAEAGCDVVDLGTVADDEDELETVLRRAAGECDAIVSSGGVSMGDYDVVKAVLGRELSGLSRKDISEFETVAKRYGAKGLAWLKVESDGVSGSFRKFFDDERLEHLVVVEGVSLWETPRVFQGLWKGGKAGFPQAVRVTALVVMRPRSISARGERGELPSGPPCRTGHQWS